MSINPKLAMSLSRLRSFWPTLLLTLACLFSVPCLGQEKPNIVLILSDDQAWTDYSFMGHKQIRTPNIDNLAKRSVVFRRGYVPTALCRPSLMTIVTGRYAHEHGVTGNDPSPKNVPRNSELGKKLKAKLISKIDRFDTLPEKLVEQGYVCHQSGKWWEGSFKQGGFTHGMTRGFPKPNGRHGDDGLKIGREGLKPVTDFVDKAIAEKKPFFVWYAPFLPHTPHNPPSRLLEKYSDLKLPKTVAKYYAMCEWFDETVGELVKHLDDKKARDNTLIVYVCDNGWIQNPNKNGFAPRSKQSAYEGGIRTPIMFSWPKQLSPADRKELCSSIDLYPTILNAAGATVPKGLPGLDLLPNLKSGKPIKRTFILGESFAHDIANLEKPEASLLYRWCIKGKWKLLLTYDGTVNRHRATHPRKEKRPQLFDLIADPSEKQNLAKDNPDVVKELVAHIDEWYAVKERKTVKVFE